jgi:AP-1 complex subunit mu
MPELQLGLNDKILFTDRQQHHRADVSRSVSELEDAKFHACVKLSQFERNRTITFIPPDGEFNLMMYRLSATIKPIIQVDSVVERHKGSRVEMLIRAHAQYRPEQLPRTSQSACQFRRTSTPPRHNARRER